MTWEDEAANWTAWARTPGHDAFGVYGPLFFDDIVPQGGGLTLEIGCGEGRVARVLTERGYRVIGIDAARAMIAYAASADQRAAYAVADGTRLPFADATFAIVVAHNALQAMHDVGDMASAVREAGRVLAAGGHLCVSVPHPMTDAGRLDDDGDALVIAGSYFERRRVEDSVSKDGLSLACFGWTYTIEDYARAIEDAGLLIDRIREPVPPSALVEVRPRLDRWRRVPHFLFLRAVKP